MEKINYTLGKVNESFELGLSFIYTDNLGHRNFSFSKWDENHFFNFRFYPYFVFRFRLKNEDDYDPNQSQSINRMDCFQFIKKGRALIQSFHDEKDLFVYDENDNLIVNKKLSEKVSTIVNLNNGKKLLLKPIALKENDSKNVFEGIVMFGNSVSVYSTFTFMEFQFLLYTLEHTNIDAIAISMATYIELVRKQEAQLTEAPAIKEIRPIQFHNQSLPTAEVKTEETVTGGSWETKKELPNI